MAPKPQAQPVEKEGIVYAMCSKKNGKAYIGSTTQLLIRMRVHLHDIRSCKTHKGYMDGIFYKHDPSDVECRILQRLQVTMRGKSCPELRKAEDAWMLQYGDKCINQKRACKVTLETLGMDIVDCTKGGAQ